MLMKSILYKFLFLLVLTIVVIQNIQSQNWEWSAHVKGANDVGAEISASDAAGNIYVGGLRRGVVEFVGSSPLVTLTSNSTLNTPFLAKYSPDGTLQWALGFGDEKASNIKGIYVDEHDDVFVVGSYQSGVDPLDPFTIRSNVGDDSLFWSRGNHDLYLAKFSGDGELLFAQNYGSTAVDRMQGVTADGSGNIAVVGFWNGGSLDFGNGVTPLVFSGSTSNGFIAKLDQNGDAIWNVGFNGPWVRLESGVATTSDQHYVASINFRTSVNLPGIGTINATNIAPKHQQVLLKVNSNTGAIEWYRHLTSSGNFDIYGGNNVITDVEGNIYFIGRFENNIIFPGDVTQTPITLTASGYDGFIVKYSSSGGLVWAKKWGGTGNEWTYWVDLKEDVISLAGVTTGTVYLGDYTNARDTIIVTGAKNEPILLNLTSDGKYLGVGRALGSEADEAMTTVVTADGNSAFAGLFRSNPIVIGSNSYALEGASDMFLAKHTNIHILPTITPVINNASQAGAIDFSVFGGGAEPYSYTLSKVGGAVIGSGIYSTPLTFSDLSGGVYKLVVEDNSGRQVTKYYHIIEPVISKVNGADELNYCTGQSVSVPLVVNVNEAQQYQWLRNGSPISGATTKNYTATVGGKYSIQITIDGELGLSNEIEIYIEGTPSSGSLAKTPDEENVCEGLNVSAILTPGSGGVEDVLQFRTFDGEEWTVWADYVSGDDISTAGLTEVQIQTYRENLYCDPVAPVTVSWLVEATPVSGTLTKSPNTANICEGTSVSANLAAGSGGNGVDELESRTNGGAWTNYTSGNSIPTAGVSTVEIRTRRMADYCENAGYNTVSWTVEATPVSGTLTKSPDATNICEGISVSATLTAGSGGNGVDELESRTNGGAWASYTSGSSIPTAGVSTVEIRTRRTASYCDDAEYNTVSWMVEATPVSGTLAKTPNTANICEGTPVSATLTAGSGGNGVDELESRTNGGAWASYTSGSSIPTAGVSTVEIRTRRTASYCDDAEYNTVSWTVEATPVSGTLTKTPNTANVCEGTSVSATLTAGSGGNGLDELESRTNGGAWANYTSGSSIPTAGVSTVEIRTRRTASYCNDAEYNTVSWTVEATPVSGTLTKTPNTANVCEGTSVSATLTAGSGGNGLDELESRTNGGAWANYTSGSSIPTAGVSTVEIRTRRTASYCNDAEYNTVSWTVEATPVSGTLAKTPNTANICEGTPVSATLTAGSGGSGVDELESRTNGGAWASYTSGSSIPTAGVSTVEIRTRRTASYCNDAEYNTVSWTVEATPVSGTLTKTPNTANVCEGTSVSATLTAGSGGNGLDELESRTNGGAWANYTSGSSIPTAGVSTVEIRTRRTASYCNDAEYNTVSWTVEATPVSGTLTKTPDATNICEGTPVSATLTAGSGGNGVDELESRTNGGAWANYTSGSLISTTGLNSIDIRTRRTADYCSDGGYNMVSWGIDPQTIGGYVLGEKTVCYGSTSGALTLSGHIGDVIRWESSANTITWTTISHTSEIYTSGVLTQTTHFRAVVKSGVCDEQASDFVTIYVDPATVGGSVSGGASVCEGELSPELSLSGHVGSIVRWESSVDGFTWSPIMHTAITYTPGILSSTTQYRAVVQSGVCEEQNSLSSTITVNPLPTVTAPADFAVCAGDPVTLSGTGTANTYTWDNSVTNGEAFTPTETKTYTVTGTITATGCQSTDEVTVTVNPLPIVTAPADFAICAGEPVTLSGTGNANTYTWDNSVTNGESFTPTETKTYTVTGTITATGCQSTDEVTVTVNPLPIVTAPADFAICAGEPVTLSGTGNANTYTWDNSVTNGESFTPTETKTYTVTGTITATGCQSTDQVTVTVNQLPTVTAPADFAVCAGEEVTLTGEGTADTYTWNNGVSNGVAFIPVETKTYTVTGVIDETGCESSDEITIYVDPQTLPGSVIGGSVICSGSNSGLLSLEDNVGIIVRWEKAVAPFDTWIPISNTSSTYTSGALTETTRFRAVVKSGVCDELPSEFTEVEVIQSVGGEIIGESLVCHGTTSGLMTLQGFEGAILRWQYNDTGDNMQWNNIPGTEGLTSYESSLLTKPTAFRVRVKNGSCATVSSEVFNVDIEPLSVGGEVIGGSEVCVGQTSEILTLSNHLGDILRWESSINNGDTWIDIAHTGTSFTSAELSQTTMFRAVVKNGVCNEVTSDPTTVIVNPYPVPVVTNTSSLSVCASDPVSVGLTVDITDAISYQWLLNGLPIQDATAQKYTAVEPGIYSVEVDVKGCLGTSNELEVVIVDNPEPLILTDDLLFYCEGENISVELTSSIPNADTYQWLLNNDPILNANSNTYLATQAGVYSLGIVVNGCVGLSDEIEIVVNPLPVVNAPADFEICAGETVTLAASGNASEYTWSNGVNDGVAFTPVETKTYTVTGKIFETGCTSSADVKVTVKPLPQPIISSQYNLNVCAGDEIDITLNVDVEDADAYQWLLNGQPIDGATADIFVATQTSDYSVEVTVHGCVGTSNVLTISIIDRPDPVISALSNLTICEGEAVNIDLTVNISNADSYQWLLNGTPISGANSKDYTATLEGLYSVEVVVNGCSAISNELLIAITEKPNPVISTLDRTTFYEGEVVSVTLEVDVDNADAYQWLLNGDEIADANQPEYHAIQVGTYSVLVTVDGCSGVSNEIVIVQVEQLLPTISTNDPLTWCEGEAIVVNFEVSVANADSYQWYRNDAAIENAQAATYIANLHGEYKVEVTLGEETAFSNMLEVSVTPKPTPVISTTDPISWCTGSSISVNFVTSISGATSYQWMLNDVDIVEATSANYTAESPGEYSVRVVVNGCEGVSNSITVVEEDELHPIISALSATELCEGDEISVTLTVDISSADSYQWRLNGNDIENATQSTFVATQAGAYSVELIAGACSGISNVVVIEVNPLPQPVISTDDKLVWGDDETIAVTFTVDIDDADAYQWLLDGSPIANAVSSSYVANQPGEYSVIVKVANCEGESNKLKVEVSSTPHFTVTFTVQNTSGAPVEGAEITVTGFNPIISSASGVATIQLPDGSYSIVVKKTDFNDYSSDFTVDGQDKAVSISLIAVSAPVDELTQISLYPNPFNHEIRISNPQIVSRAIITNMAGQKVMEVQLDGQDRIYTQVLPSGVYLLRLISTDGRSAIFRMVKEK